MIRPDTPGISLRRLAIPLSLYGAAIGWGMLQTLPVLPDDWAHPIWSEAELVLGALPRLVSLSPAAGREGEMALIGHGLAFLLAVQMGRSNRRAARLIEGLGLSGGVVAAYGLVVYLSGTEKILWLDKWAYPGDLTATQVNRNHYATLAGLGLLCALAAILIKLNQFGRRKCLRLVLGGRDWWLIGMLAAVPILATALLLTHSRAGAAASVLAAMVFLILAQGRKWQPILVQMALLIAFSLAVLAELDNRVGELSADTDQRLRVYLLGLEILSERPWLGYGLGGFADAFQAIRPVSITQYWPQAHNSWLELMIELGIPAALCLFLAGGWAAMRCVAGVFLRHQNRELAALGVAASVLVGLHALVDFSLQIPAVAVTFAAILGVGVAQSWSSTRGQVVE